MNTMNRDARNEASQVLSRIFAGRAITSVTTNGGTQTLTLDNGETVTIRDTKPPNSTRSAIT